MLSRGLVTILIVDDDPIVLRATQERLARAGFRVKTEQNAVSALRRLRHDGITLALIDASLPGQGGELLAVEATRCFSRHRIVLHSGWPAHELANLSRQHRLLGFVQKTGDDTAMLQALEQLLTESAERIKNSDSIPPANVRCS